MATERTVMVRLKADVNAFNRGMLEAAAGVNALRKEINTANDRTAWLTQGILAIAPAVVPLGAAAIPVFTGLATQMTVAGVAAGTLALGFHGIGDALTALNAYQLAPTDANLLKLHQTMSKLSTEGRQFVRFLDTAEGGLTGLSHSAQRGMFPGMTSGIEHLLTLMPQVRKIVAEISKGIGELANEAGAGLAGPKFEGFFRFLEHDAKPILLDLGRTVGHLAAGLAGLFVDFLPESEKFSTGLLNMSKRFDEWAQQLDKTQGFQDFLAYIDKSGPEALHFLGALSNLILAVVEAAAPIGNVMLPALTQVVNVFADLASTPLGSIFIGMAAAMSLYGRSVAIAGNLTTKAGSDMGRGLGMADREAIKAVGSVRSLAANVGVLGRNMMTAGANSERMAEQNRVAASGIKEWGKSAAKVGGQAALLGVAASGVADKFGLANTANLALAGSLAGPYGAAVGGAVGLVMDLSKHQDAAVLSVDDLTASLNQQTGALTGNTRQMAVQALEQAGALANAQKLGLSLGLVTDAALGNKSALAEVNAELDKHIFALNESGSAANNHTGAQVEDSVAAQKLKAALNDTNGTLAESRRGWERTHAALTHATTATGKLNTAQKALAVHMRAAKQAAAASIGQWNLLGDDVDKAKVSLDKWIREMQKTADALASFGANARKAADRGLKEGLIKQLESLGPAGALRMKQLADASDTQIHRANHAWASFQSASTSAMNALSKATTRRYRISIDTSQGVQNLLNMQAQIDRLHGKTIIIRTVGGHSTVGYDTGGFTGWGGHYEPAGIVHRNELVLPEDVVKADWSFLKSRYGYLPGFAEGGLVGMSLGATPQSGGGGGGGVSVALAVDEIPVRGRVDIDTGAFMGMARVVARQEIDADRDFDEKRANQ